MAEERTFCPKVSIVIPVYNGANYLKESIDSALAQTYSNLEVIVVNDGSCDNGATEEVALSYGDKIRYFSKENGGVSSALNRGIHEMTGDYFSWLSHDDKYEPTKVANSVAYLAEFEQRDHLVALCGGYYINEKSEKIRDMAFGFERDRIYHGSEVMRYILKHGALNACCMLIPKRAFDECGCFNEDLRYNQDALMWYQIFSKGYDLVVDPEQRDVMYRLHANQTSKLRRDLLLRDSYAMSKIMAPVLASMSTESCNLLRLYAKRDARIYCVDAVNECIRVGGQEGIFRLGDLIYIRIWVLLGLCRNLLKKLYHKIAFNR